MTGLLLKREGAYERLFGVAGLGVHQNLKPGDVWMGVFLPDNTRVGFINTNAMADSRNGHLGLTTTVTARLRLTLMATPTDIFISGTTWLPADGTLSEFQFKLRSGDHAMQVKAAVQDGMLNGAITTAGQTIPLQFPVGGKLSLSGALGATSMSIPALKPGQEIVVDTFDPMTFSAGKARVKWVGEETLEVAGEQVKTTVISTELNGLVSKAWLAPNEDVIQASTPLGFTLRKITLDEAMKPVGQSDGRNLLQAVAIQPTGKRPFRGAAKMVVEVSGVGGEWRPPDGPAQQGDGRVYTLTAGRAPGESHSLEGADADALAGSPLIQTDNPKIVETAKSIIGAETDPWKKAQAIYEWVYGHIRKVSVFSIPSALDVLESGEGDCNEHTALYTALARAVGVPTRMAIGIVWSDDLNGFYYHAWPEVYVGGWVPIDPTLGQPLADATHFALLYGDIQHWTQLIPYLGQLKLDVKSVE